MTTTSVITIIVNNPHLKEVFVGYTGGYPSYINPILELMAKAQPNNIRQLKRLVLKHLRDWHKPVSSDYATMQNADFYYTLFIS